MTITGDHVPIKQHLLPAMHCTLEGLPARVSEVEALVAAYLGIEVRKPQPEEITFRHDEVIHPHAFTILPMPDAPKGIRKGGLISIGYGSHSVWHPLALLAHEWGHWYLNGLYRRVSGEVFGRLPNGKISHEELICITLEDAACRRFGIVSDTRTTK